MTTDWQAKAEAFRTAVAEVEAMVAVAEAGPGLSHGEAVRLVRSTGGIVEEVAGLISGLQRSGADPAFVGTLRTLLGPLRAADARAAKLVAQVAPSSERAGAEGASAASGSTTRPASSATCIAGGAGTPPGKLSLAGDGSYSLTVVVERFDQGILEALFGPRQAAGHRPETFVTGELRPEDGNLYDANAVAVLVSGLKVGRLSREDARRFHEAAALAGGAGRSVAVQLLVAQSGRGPGDDGAYQVRLDAALPLAFETGSEQMARSA